MIQVIGQCVEAGNEMGARNLFDVLETLLILVRYPYDGLAWKSIAHFLCRLVLRVGLVVVHQEIPILGPHIPQLAEFLLTCGGNRNYDNELRVLSLNALNWTVQ